MVDRLVYNTVLSQAFSPCGNYLTASNNYGDIAVYRFVILFEFFIARSLLVVPEVMFSVFVYLFYHITLNGTC